MANEKRFLSIGLFVLFGFGLIIGILLWFSVSSRQSYNTYRVDFHEAVDGVSTSSVVKYNGVEVGRVVNIQLDPDNHSTIFVDINVLSDMKLTTATYASLKSQGVTGMSYISLSLDSKIKNPQVITPHNSLPYPNIPSHLSLLTTLTDQAERIGTNISTISGDITQLLNESNITHVNHILHNIDVLTTALAKQSVSIESSVLMAAQVMQNVNENTKNLNVAIIELGQLSHSLESNSAQLGMVLDTVQNETLININSVFLPNLNQSVTNMNTISAQFNDLLRTINNNPSIFVRGTAPAKSGPKE